MLRLLSLLCITSFLVAGCSQRPREEELVGRWHSGCSIDICTITTLNSDHTFSQKFDDKNITDDSFAGSWRLEGDELVLHVTRADTVIQQMVGTDMHFALSKFRRDKFIAEFHKAGNPPSHAQNTLASQWKRLQ
jgi:hypothetical protein